MYVVKASSQISKSTLRTIRREAWMRMGTSSYSIANVLGFTVPSLSASVWPRGRKTVLSLGRLMVMIIVIVAVFIIMMVIVMIVIFFQPALLAGLLSFRIKH